MDTILNLTHATQETKYLASLIEDLPQNVFFNKVICGCGGTQLALTNDKPYVIVVPTTDPILSKKNQSETNPEKYPHGVLWVYGTITVKQIIDYLDNGGVKIFSTYHSLYKVMEAFKSSTKRTNQFQFLIDEAHMLTEGDDKDFMHNEINYVLQVFKEFKSYCFMTATPFPRDCFPEQIMDIPLVTAEWNPTVVTQTVIKAQQVDGKFNDYVLNIAIQYINKEIDGNAYFFYNSVEAISQIAAKLIKSGICTKDDIRLIVSKKNSAYVKKYIGSDVEIEDVTTGAKKLNFITARCFEGADIYDEEGRTYVCADGQKKHTRLEIHTKVPQIINRIRNSKYNNEVYMLYRTSYIPVGMSLPEYKVYIEQQVAKVGRQLKEIETVSAELKELINQNLLETNEFITRDLQNNLIPNVNAGKRGIALYASQTTTYSSYSNSSISHQNVDNNLIKIMFEGGNTNQFTLPDGVNKIKLGGKKANFTKMCKEYIEALNSKDHEAVEFIETYDDIFKHARKEFGKAIEDHFSAVSWRRHTLEVRLNIQKGANSEMLRQDILSSFNIGFLYTKDAVKKKIQNMYDASNVKKTAKATTIKEFFEVKDAKNSDGDNCFKIIRKI